MSIILCDRHVELVSVETLKPYARNARTHTKKQVAQIARSIKRFGWTTPILVDADMAIIAGHGRLEAAKSLGLAKVPVIKIDDLTPAQVKALRLADNKIAENAGWDVDLLKIEFEELISADVDFEITDTGFEMGELDLILAEPDGDDDEDELADDDVAGLAIAKPGDIFACGPHYIVCADARDAAAYDRLLGHDQARSILTDPPYNVKIDGNVSRNGRHGEFAMASGEMSDDEHRTFLDQCLRAMAAHAAPGALCYQFIDWRHVDLMAEVGRAAFGSLIDICVWDKGSGGMGSPYRSAHEFVCVFKQGRGKPINNVQLGRFGRNRTNVWRYRGLNSFGAGRSRALTMHPTVKPTAMIADAMLDCTNRNDIVLDPFAGSGTILVAAHRTGRHARAMEIDPAYVDVALRRFRRITGIEPIHVASGKSLAELEAGIGAKQPSCADQEDVS